MNILISIINFVSPFIVAAGILYICCGWVLVYFKRVTLLEKYFFDSFETRYCSIVLLLTMLFFFGTQILIPQPPDQQLSVLGVGFVVTFCVFLIVFVISALSSFRNKINPQ